MKIYKAITTYELESHTKDGWTWDGAERREQRVTEEPDINGRPMTAEEREQHGYGNSYSSYNAPKIYNHKHFFGDVLIFIVWKDDETIQREQAAESRANTAEWELKKLNEEAAKHPKEIETLKKQFQESQAVARTRQEQLNARDERNRKLEGDLAKVRNAIGEMQMNEILGIKKPS